MPNQRKRGKANVTAWVPDSLKVELRLIAKHRGVPLSVVIEEMLRDQSEKYRERAHGNQSKRAD